MKPKIAIIVYHKNAGKIYPEAWVNQFRESILNQTYKDFHILEHNYGGEDWFIFDNAEKHGHLRNDKKATFVDAMNELLDRAFNEYKYDYVFNTNVDDYYALNRIERQLPYLRAGHDVVASNFHLVRDDQIIYSHNFKGINIGAELEKENNPIGHPVVGYSKSFWEKHRYVPEEIPKEDLRLWQRAYKDSKFIILPDFLLYHRIHNNSVCQNKENR